MSLIFIDDFHFLSTAIDCIVEKCNGKCEESLTKTYLYIDCDKFSNYKFLNRFLILRERNGLVVITENVSPKKLKILLALGVKYILTTKDEVSCFEDIASNSHYDFYFSPTIMEVLKILSPDFINEVNRSVNNKKLGLLTKRERMVLIELLSGFSQKSIARRHFRSEKTISSQKSSLLIKLEERSMISLLC
ncbi:response regulator transcription factor [Serratia ureilytica]|uniref:response regulator transcription factor n=1 Tax=Serratia ureilytica TaxID=300181 RepID=UPI0034C6BDB7